MKKIFAFQFVCFPIHHIQISEQTLGLGSNGTPCHWGICWLIFGIIMCMHVWDYMQPYLDQFMQLLNTKIGSIYYRQQSWHAEYSCSTSSTEVKHLCAMIALGNHCAGSVGLDVNDAKRYRTCVTSEPSHCCIVPLYNSGRAPFSGDLWGQEDMVTYPQWTENIDFIQKRWNNLENLLALSTSSDKPNLNIQKMM